MNVVIDTNVLVSAAWSPGRAAYEIIQAAAAGKFNVCYDYRILEEYNRVMHNPKFGFEDWEITAVLEPIKKNGICFVADSLPNVYFSDESDRKFYEVAKACHAILVTGNMKHYPEDGTAMKTADFYKQYIIYA